MLDVVYILGSGSVWQDNELRYSLRSLSHFEHRNVVIVGECPEWVRNVRHIPYPDTHSKVNGGKFKNVLKKIRAACIDEEISEQFVLMNDDFFFLRDCPAIQPYTVGPLSEMIVDFIDRYGEANNQYVSLLKRTEEHLKEQGVDKPDSFAIHYPMIHKKRQFLDMLADVEWEENPMSWRTVYGNLYTSVTPVKREDPKLNNVKDLEAFLGDLMREQWDFLSVGDKVTLDRRFQEWIAERFPEPSIYEL